MTKKETPEQKRETLRQKELKENPASSFQGSRLPDLVGSLSWKGTGILILIVILSIIIYSVFFH
ncbi:DUF6366 family protein [Gracilibacillus sp. HCP3S3_G5_1]|uniref:DUF6366 family protein n=1 Tax=unclassified Gracilibacillus TaxID=2625209 RepID=UPI003F88BF32